MVRDAVCGMQVDPAAAPSIEVAGRTFYFCAQGCKNAFELELAGGGLLGDPAAIPCRYYEERAEQQPQGGKGPER